jgi:hypothetical protein
MMLEIMDDYEQQKLQAIKKDNKKIGEPHKKPPARFTKMRNGREVDPQEAPYDEAESKARRNISLPVIGDPNKYRRMNC